MFKALFKIIINLMGTIIQLVVFPLNLAITNALPDLSTKILNTSQTILGVFNSMNWALGLVPDAIIETILFIIVVEIAKHTIYLSTHTLIKVWNIFQKIKFW